MEGREQMPPILLGSGQLQGHQQVLPRLHARGQDVSANGTQFPLLLLGPTSRLTHPVFPSVHRGSAMRLPVCTHPRRKAAIDSHVHTGFTQGLCGALPCPRPLGEEKQPPDRHFWVRHAIRTPGRQQRRVGLPDGDAQPRAAALPFHTPPWRGPLGTRGEIPHRQTSWLAPGTGEREQVSTSLAGHTMPIPPPGSSLPKPLAQETARGLLVPVRKPQRFPVHGKTGPSPMAGEWSHRVKRDLQKCFRNVDIR